MSSSNLLRKNTNQHTVKNLYSKTMDKDIVVVIKAVIESLKKKYPKLLFEHQSTMSLTSIVAQLCKEFPQYASAFTEVSATSFIKPDGGFLFAVNRSGDRRLILVAEVKRQGTNNKRATEGLAKQARGNAIERLGKNLIGVRTIFKHRGVLSFVCFGSGDDFAEDSSIIDRVKTMNEFFPLNNIFVEKTFLPFEPVSMFFRYRDWSTKEITTIALQVATQAIEYRFVS